MRVAGAGPKEYVMHRVVGLTVGIEKQKDGARICQFEGASNGTLRYL